MAMIILNEPKPDLFSAWQQQIGRERGARLCRGVRPFCAIFFRCRGDAVNGLVELDRLRVDVLHDLHRIGGTVVHRFARYTLGLGADRILIGGGSRLQLEKNLSLTPGRKSYGRRIGAKDTKLLGAALEIDKYLERHSKYPHYPRRSTPKLPQFFVGLSVEHATGSGPEFERFCADTGWPRDLALTSVRHLHRGKWLYPIQFVWHHSQHIRGVYADLRTVPARQAFHFERPGNLIGAEGACRFDFWGSSYRSASF